MYQKVYSKFRHMTLLGSTVFQEHETSVFFVIFEGNFFYCTLPNINKRAHLHTTGEGRDGAEDNTRPILLKKNNHINSSLDKVNSTKIMIIRDSIHTSLHLPLFFPPTISLKNRQDTQLEHSNLFNYLKKGTKRGSYCA